MRFFDTDNAAMMTKGERRVLNLVCEAVMEDEAAWQEIRDNVMSDVLDAWSPQRRVSEMVAIVVDRRRNARNNAAFRELSNEAGAMLSRIEDRERQKREKDFVKFCREMEA